MQVKKFEAPTLQEALDAVKRELGPEAVILQTKRNKRGFGLLNQASIEVTAAISNRSLQKKSYTEKRLPEGYREALQSLPPSKQAQVMNQTVDRQLSRMESKNNAAQQSAAITKRRYVEIDEHELPKTAALAPAPKKQQNTLEDEMRQMKRIIQEMQASQDESVSIGAISTPLSQSPALQDAFEQLVLNGVDKRQALALIRKAAFELGSDQIQNPDSVLDQIALEIVNATETLNPLENLAPDSRGDAGPFLFLVVGPTGVGKTTTIAKIASHAMIQQKLKIGLINLDTYKVAAFNQMSTYAQILNVPFRTVSTSEELQSALADFKSLDLVLIDTTGRSQRDIESLEEMSQLIKTIEQPVQTHLVLSASTRDTELYDCAKRFSIFKPTTLIMTKLDEARIYGAVHNASQRAKLPLSWFTVGQRVPEDIEIASPERVAALILEL